MITSSPPSSSPTRPLFGSSASRRPTAKVYSRRSATTASSSASRPRPRGGRVSQRAGESDDEATDDDAETDTDKEEETQVDLQAERNSLGRGTRASGSRGGEGSLSTAVGLAERPGKKRKLDVKTPSADDVTPTTRRTRSGTLGRAVSTPTLASAIESTRSVKAKGNAEAEASMSFNVLPPSSPTPIIDRRDTSKAAPAAPHTPPSQRIKRTISEGISPRNLAAQFSMTAHTPGSPSSVGGGSGSPRPRLGRMLTKTQSLGITASPSRLREVEADVFGSELSSLGQLTPGKLSRTTSLPSTPSKTPGRNRLLDEGEDGTAGLALGASLNPLVMPEKEREATGSGGRAKRVYGRQRTMLAEGMNLSPRSGVSSGPEEVVKESYKELRKLYEVDNSGEDLVGDVYADLLAARNGQSVADLKSKGENRRFMDQLGYLIDPVTDSGSSVSLKRSSAFNLLSKSQDPEWLAKLKICGQVERVWEAIHQTRDDVSDTISLLYMAVLLQSGGGIESIVADDRCVELAVGMLKVDNGPLDEGYVGKVAGLITRMRSAYTALDLGWTQSISSTRRLASYALSQLSSPSLHSRCADALASNEALRRTMRSLKAEVALLSDRKDLVTTGLPLLNPAKPADIEHIRQCIETVAHLIAECADNLASLAEWDEQTATCFSDGLICGVHVTLNDPDVSAVGAKIVCDLLQILAVLVTASPAWAAYMGSPTLLVALTRVLVYRTRIAQSAGGGTGPSDSTTRQDKGDMDNPFDTAPSHLNARDVGLDGTPTEEDLLCLVLALLTTGALRDAGMVRRISETAVSTSCTAQSKCFEQCACNDQTTLARLLVDVYLSHSSEDSSESSGIISSYTALLIAKIVCTPNLSTEQTLVTSGPIDVQGHDTLSTSMSVTLDALPGSDTGEKLQGLMERLSELGGLEKWAVKGTGTALSAGDNDTETGNGGGGDQGVVQGVMHELRRTMRDLGVKVTMLSPP